MKPQQKKQRSPNPGIKINETVIGAGELDPDLQQQQQQQETGMSKQPTVFKDHFLAESDAWDTTLVRGIDLPKMLFKQTKYEQACHERSVVMVYVESNPEAIQNNQFLNLFKASTKGEIKFRISWTSPPSPKKKKGSSDDREIYSTWTFEGARIQGLDFGTAEAERPMPNVIAIEVAYNNLKIDGISL